MVPLFTINLIQQGVSIRRLQTTFHNGRCFGLLVLRCISRLALGRYLPQIRVFYLQIQKFSYHIPFH